MKLHFTLSIFAALVFSSCGTKSVAGSSSTASAQSTTLSSALVDGKNLYENNCANCHGLFKATDFTKEAWAPILVEMQKKASLSDAQMQQISSYIYAQL